MNIRAPLVLPAVLAVAPGSGPARLRTGSLVLLAWLDADEHEQARGLVSAPLFGVLLGRDPRDTARWIVAPADALPVAGEGDVWVGAPADPSCCGSLWVRVSDAMSLSDGQLRRLQRAGEMDEIGQAALLARVMVRTQRPEWPASDGECELDDGLPVLVSREELAGWLRAAVPKGTTMGEALWSALAKWIAEDAARDPEDVPGLASGAPPLRYAAAVAPVRRSEWSCSLADGRRLVLRRGARDSQVLVMIELADDVVEVRVNGRRAEVGGFGYLADVDLVADEGMVSIAVTTGIGVTLNACFALHD
jgi:hypothetical protein